MIAEIFPAKSVEKVVFKSRNTTKGFTTRCKAVGTHKHKRAGFEQRKPTEGNNRSNGLPLKYSDGVVQRLLCYP